MTSFGYTLMCEQRGPRELVSDAVAAERAYAWSVLGAVAAATERVELMTSRDGLTFDGEHFRVDSARLWDRPEDVAAAIPCGPDVTAQVEAVRPFVDAGFSHVALVQMGGDTQPEYLRFAERELLPALRAAYGDAQDSPIRPRR
jgi:hypothetical protein